MKKVFFTLLAIVLALPSFAYRIYITEDEKRSGYDKVESKEFINPDGSFTYYVECKDEGPKKCEHKCGAFPHILDFISNIGLSEPVYDAIIALIQSNVDQGITSGTIINGNVTFVYCSNAKQIVIDIN